MITDPTSIMGLRSLRDLALLWRPPDRQKKAAEQEGNPGSAAEKKTNEEFKLTPRRGEPQRGRR